MRKALKDAGVHNYSISLHPTTLQLFAFAEVRGAARRRQRSAVDGRVAQRSLRLCATAVAADRR